jgi:hypothetical protein
LELEEIASVLRTAVERWRADHPGHPWADEAALGSQ